MFAERYVNSVNASDLRDDQFHRAAEPLRAAAYADKSGGEAVLGSLLCRVKYADGSVHKLFEAGTANLLALLRIWLPVVRDRGVSRKWLPVARTTWDAQARETLFQRVAETSLAHWMDGRCELCSGAGQTGDRRLCSCCGGTGRAQVIAGRFESGLITDMVSELEGIYQAHSGRAALQLRRVA